MIITRYSKVGEVSFEVGSQQANLLREIDGPRNGFLCRHKGTRLDPGLPMLDEFEVFRDRWDVAQIEQPIITVLGKQIDRVFD